MEGALTARGPKKTRTGQSKAKSKGALKTKQLGALEHLRDQLGLLVRLQGKWVNKAHDSDDPRQIHDHRLWVYDQFMQALVAAFEQLEATLSERHPGGAPSNKYRDLAFDVLTDHYIANSKILKAKTLVRALGERLPEGALGADASGKEPFTQRIAGAVIRDFKACLNSTPNDWN